MCDTLCALSPEGLLFTKESDRPSGEVRVPQAFGPRPGDGRLRTQYLEIDSPGAAAVLLSASCAAEHGFNQHGVAIGNEKIDTVSGKPPLRATNNRVPIPRHSARDCQAAGEALQFWRSGPDGSGTISHATSAGSEGSRGPVADGPGAWLPFATLQGPDAPLGG